MTNPVKLLFICLIVVSFSDAIADPFLGESGKGLGVVKYKKDGDWHYVIYPLSNRKMPVDHLTTMGRFCKSLEEVNSRATRYGGNLTLYVAPQADSFSGDLALLKWLSKHEIERLTALATTKYRIVK